MSVENIKYNNPPIIEAICEFRFSDSKEWDWTIPGILYSSLKENFPEKKEIRGMGFEFSIKKRVNPKVSKYSESVDRLQFWSENKEKVVQIGENRLIVNKRTPYEGWDNFSELIFEIVEKYGEISENQDVVSFSLRYINKIEELPNPLDLEQYFSIYPKFPDNLNVAVGPLNVQGNFSIDLNERVDSQIQLNFFNQEERDKEGRKISWIIDINVIVNPIDEPILLSEIEEDINSAHDKLIETFESCITDDLRNIFGVIK